MNCVQLGLLEAIFLCVGKWRRIGILLAQRMHMRKGLRPLVRTCWLSRVGKELQHECKREVAPVDV